MCALIKQPTAKRAEVGPIVPQARRAEVGPIVPRAMRAEIIHRTRISFHVAEEESKYSKAEI